ncbi:MAG TPA: GIY-YIG nuclease family protein [Candidatus Paceibacterota bacterium]
MKKINKKLPDKPGIYIFKGKSENILYIGRATSILDRLKSYFRNDLIHARGSRLVDMVTKAINIEYKETDSVLEAIILEANEIRKHQPYYNTAEKDNKSYNYAVITHEEFPRVIISRERALDTQDFKIKYKFGPYPHGSLLKDALKIIRKIFPFRDAKANLKYQESFYKSIGLSPDNISKQEYEKTVRNLVLFFEGKKKKLIKILEKEMDTYAETQEFEKARKVRNTLYALQHIQDVSLIKKENLNIGSGYRIEAYDIAHFSGKDVVGVMTAVVDGTVDKSQYKKFKISKEANDDTAALKEVLTRRFNHTEWKLPDLIVIDGGMGQWNAARSIIKDIPTVAVVKGEDHKPSYFLGDENLVNTHKMPILLANSESHRFAINYHKLRRKKSFLGRVAKKNRAW